MVCDTTVCGLGGFLESVPIVFPLCAYGQCVCFMCVSGTRCMCVHSYRNDMDIQGK